MDFVTWFRSVAPYINSFRHKVFVVAFGGEVVADGKFIELVHDLNLLASLGVRLVLVHGARPQIESRLNEHDLQTTYIRGMRVTDAAALQCVKESIGRVRVEIEALLSMGLPNSPMANAAIRVASGNFVTARPIGVIEGIDLMHTGEVRKVDISAIRSRLEQGELALLSPLGYSPTGEIFNLTLENVAAEAAIALKAEKLIFLMDTQGIEKSTADSEQALLLRELTVGEGRSLLKEFGRKMVQLAEDAQLYLPFALHACERGVSRVHLISRHVDGAILQELFTHSGIGTMISEGPLQNLRDARIEDVGAILQLIEPLEADGTLVRRSRELLEMEIDRFVVIEHDRMIVGCAALYPFPDDMAGELACLTVHPDYRSAGCGDALLKAIEAKARSQGSKKLFVLTTRTAHWFVERGFLSADVSQLPKVKQGLYNYQRRSKVFMKPL
ncbi:amino-acid N-acetyltransferase [Nitrosospira multiformis]|uniref:Amino-acid acetyltransferase n=1 Tax=Nitrosospira multiformis (strain ATCC 25196 / NCIMB 11849 / C 71) TaxID=323848 RepID=Q2YC33_NITMU|nr:amino-acid N-acetyltransferase [Nitrosospira multiformis]ABB73688.1 N-acetylglutamate synthase [Nitrosospira multiformis ATCC 25196]SDZ75338.1 N-acetylglutamate synthase [Nitrosospira multiformis]SEF39892.1 N-acetylglutamate synthase [Nitrosospira multiformis ATCC 25196]